MSVNELPISLTSSYYRADTEGSYNLNSSERFLW